MSKTLLKMVQDILSSMDSDEVNSINDTVEAQQVVTAIETTYDELLNNLELPPQYTLFQLDASADATKPVTMAIPDHIDNLEWVKYNRVDTTNTQQQYHKVTFLPKEEFLNVVNSYLSTDSNVLTYNLVADSVNIPLLCLKDRAPDFYTTFNERTLVFNSYLATLESTLQSSKTLCYGKQKQTFQASDSWVFPIEDKFMPLLYNEAKALCFAELKQITNQRAEKAARRSRIKTQANKTAVEYGSPAYNGVQGYGRRV